VQESEAVDTLFDSICAGNLDLSTTLLSDHIEQVAPSLANNPGASTPSPLSDPSNLEFGPTPTAHGITATRKTLEASGTVFMIVRNGCDGVVRVRVRQSLMARVAMSLHNTFEILDAMMVVLVLAATAVFVYTAMLLCKVGTVASLPPLDTLCPIPHLQCQRGLCCHNDLDQSAAADHNCSSGQCCIAGHEGT
jgi:hypothetical protein